MVVLQYLLDTISVANQGINTMKQTQVRIPADVHQWLTDRAKVNDRSMNAELVRILKEVKAKEEEQKAAA